MNKFKFEMQYSFDDKVLHKQEVVASGNHEFQARVSAIRSWPANKPLVQVKTIGLV